MDVKKKTGEVESFDPDRVFQVVMNALDDAVVAQGGNFSEDAIDMANTVTQEVQDEVSNYAEPVDVSIIQDAIYGSLVSNGQVIAAREYLHFSDKKMQLRADNQSLINAVDKVFKNDPSVVNENGNKDSRTLATKRDLVTSQVFRERGIKMYPKEVQKYYNEGLIYLHDRDMSPLLPYTNCCNVNISDMLENGFRIGETKFSQPHSIQVAVNQISIIVQSVSNSQYGGTSIPDVDIVLAPYAKMNYDKHVLEGKKYGVRDVLTYAWELTRKDIYEAMQALENEINSLLGSGGGQTPFSTVSFGFSTGKFETEIQKAMLKVRIKGLNGKTAIFPKLIFFVTDGINLKPSDPNYDVKQLALKCSSERDYPDIVFTKNIEKITGAKEHPMTPMGCVRGQSIISYEYGGNKYTTSFEKMYDQFSDKEKVQENGIDRCIDLKGVTIKDSHTGTVKYVDCLRVIKNVTPHKWLRIYANAGKVFECTDNHPLEVYGKGRVLAKDLEVGDKIISSIPLVREPQGSYNNNDIDMAWLLGVVICDGCLSCHSETLISYALDGENEIRDKVGSLYSKEHLRDTEHHRGKKGNYREVAIKDSKFRDLCVKYFKGVNKDSRVIPDFVFSANKEVQLGFLSGMIDADGYVNKRTQKVQIGSVNKALAFGQYELMNILGLRPKVYVNHFNKKDSSRIRYRIECHATRELADYIQCEKKKNNISLNRRTNKSKDTGEITRIEPLDIDEPCYDVTTESDFFDVDGIVSHNCRSFLPAWRNPETGKEQVSGRLNLGVVTIDPVRIALLSKGDKRKFWGILKDTAEVAHKALRYRIDRVRSVNPEEAPILWMYGAIARLKPGDDVTPILKGGRCTASLGYIGLFETVATFYGTEWEDNPEAVKFGLSIVEYLHDQCAKWYDEEGYWYSLYSTPSENLTDRFCRKDRKDFGDIKDITDKGFYVNSFHYAEWKPVSPFVKLKFECPYHYYATGGLISYVEYESEIRNNLPALEAVWDYANKIGVGYLGTNCPISKCLACGYTGMIEQTSKGYHCPYCGNEDLNKLQIVIRLCGYLSSLSERPVVEGRMKEIQARVFHNMSTEGLDAGGQKVLKQDDKQ